MPFAGWVRDRLRCSSTWCDELAQLRRSLAAERRTATTLERMCELAWATEYCDPDRGRALTLYLDAWRGGHAAARDPARQLAGLLGAHMTLAEIAMADGDLRTAGAAFLDAGLPNLAVEPLEQFVKTRPPGASAVTETMRLEGVTALLALARGQRFDAEREIADTLARAHHATGTAAAAAYLHAARIARAAHLDDRLAGILAAATRACPTDDALAALVEARLFETGTTDELLAHYSARLERTTSRAEYAERARTAGVELIARNLQPGLGLRLLRMSLEHTYSALLPGITSHIAAWELLWTHAQAQRSTLDLLPLIVQALSAPLPEDDALYLAQRGLEITWRHASDPTAAKPYAGMVLDFVPDHPLAVAFVKEAAPEMVAVPAPAPVPAPPPVADVSPVTPIPPTATSRIPVLDGPVKRVEPAPSAAKHAHRISGRMALLTRPAPPPPPPAYQLRAPRKVVPVDVVIELPNGAFFSTVLRDLSVSGAFIVTKRELEVGTIVALEMRIPSPGAVSQANHRASARIARRTDMGCGLAFLDATPELLAAIRAIIE